MNWMNEPVVLVYDGMCAFCIRSLNVLKRFDAAGRLELVDSTDTALVAKRFPMLQGADFSEAMYGVADGRVYKGFDAFRRAAWALPQGRAIAPLLYVPGVPQTGRVVYAKIARNRRSFGCDSGVCELPPP